MSSIEEGLVSLTQTFSEVDEVDAAEEITENNEVIQSTRQILDTHSEYNKKNMSVQALSTIRIYDNVWQRIPSLYQLSAINNRQIEVQLLWYKKHKDYFERISKRAEPFLYLITDEVEKRKIPGEIALLPIIESAFKTDAYSRQKAAGLWQFVPSTGRYFGLKQTWWYDGRLDVYMSTDASLTYLTQLNKYYKGDWLLALAAYNAGAGNVDKAIKRNRKQAKSTDYWSLDLPKETQRYIPKLLAIAKLIQNSEKYHLQLYPIDNKPHLELVDIQSQTDLAVLAKLSSMSIAELKIYNPAFKQWSTDPDGPHHLLLPINKVDQFNTQLAQINDSERIKTYRHKIRSGENLSLIAQRYKVSINSLKQVNHLKNSRIKAGKYLLIPSAHNIQKPIKVSSKQSISGKKKYTVKKGDSFWSISRHFKLSHKKLATMNGFSSGDTLSIGQVLIIENPVRKKIDETI